MELISYFYVLFLRLDFSEHFLFSPQRYFRCFFSLSVFCFVVIIFSACYLIFHHKLLVVKTFKLKDRRTHESVLYAVCISLLSSLPYTTPTPSRSRGSSVGKVTGWLLVHVASVPAKGWGVLLLPVGQTNCDTVSASCPLATGYCSAMSKAAGA
jgi:hypothetical protein